jgi:hypothetical protein
MSLYFYDNSGRSSVNIFPSVFVGFSSNERTTVDVDDRKVRKRPWPMCKVQSHNLPAGSKPGSPKYKAEMLTIQLPRSIVKYCPNDN